MLRGAHVNDGIGAAAAFEDEATCAFCEEGVDPDDNICWNVVFAEQVGPGEGHDVVEVSLDF